MRWMHASMLLGLASPALAQETGQERGQVIIVTGTPLPQAGRSLRDCIARHCPPEEDIAASLAYAENQFVAGDYEGARRTIKASIGRNNRYASQYPVPVSSLYRAGSRVASHLGEGHDYEQSTWGIKRALKAGLEPEDPRLIAADLEVAGMQASIGRPDRAAAMYQEAISVSARRGRPDLAAMARLRLAWLSELEGDRPAARRGLQQVADDRNPAARAARLSALVLLARLDRLEGRTESSDALIAELRGARLAKPALLFAPEIEMPSRLVTLDREEGKLLKDGSGAGGSTLRLMRTENFDDRWIDVGFWVTPEGHVSDVDILRHRGPTYWADPLLESIAGRIYTPGGEPGSEGVYRVERYSFTSLWEERTGTHLRQRSASARLEYLDLTEERAPGQPDR
jgi:tetratricopeptide (TPR) repeat protein